MDSAFDIIKNNSIENSNIARAYGLIKVHKEDFPVRVIVFTIGSPSYSLDKAISRFFQQIHL